MMDEMIVIMTGGGIVIMAVIRTVIGAGAHASATNSMRGATATAGSSRVSSAGA